MTDQILLHPNPMADRRPCGIRPGALATSSIVTGSLGRAIEGFARRTIMHL